MTKDKKPARLTPEALEALKQTMLANLADPAVEERVEAQQTRNEEALRQRAPKPRKK